MVAAVTFHATRSERFWRLSREGAILAGTSVGGPHLSWMPRRPRQRRVLGSREEGAQPASWTRKAKEEGTWRENHRGVQQREHSEVGTRGAVEPKEAGGKPGKGRDTPQEEQSRQ